MKNGASSVHKNDWWHSQSKEGVEGHEFNEAEQCAESDEQQPLIPCYFLFGFKETTHLAMTSSVRNCGFIHNFQSLHNFCVLRDLLSQVIVLSLQPTNA